MTNGPIPCRAVFLDAGGVIVLPDRGLLAGALRGVDDRQGARGGRVIPALPADPHRRGQQPDLLVVADRGRALACPLGQLADGQRREVAGPGIGI